LVANFFLRNFISYSLPQLLSFLPFFGMLLILMLLSACTAPWNQKKFWMAFLVAYALFPSEASGGAHLNQRFLPFVVFFLPLGLKLSRLKFRSVQILSLATTLLMALYFYGGMKKVEATVHEAKAVLSPLPSPSRLYPINFDTHGPGLTYSSIFHLWATYDDSKIVFSPSLFAHLNLLPLSQKIPPSLTYFPCTEETLPEAIARDEI